MPSLPGTCSPPHSAIGGSGYARNPLEAQRHHEREAIGRCLAIARQDAETKRGWAGWRAKRTYAMLAIVSYTGVRKMEALYLRREDIDLEARMLIIRPRRDARLKTEASAAPVAIPPALAPILADWFRVLDTSMPAFADGAFSDPARRAIGAQHAMGTRKGVADPDWVIPNVYRTGPWLGGSPGHRPIDLLHRIGERAGLHSPLTFQSLRHSWATHAEHWGLSDEQIRRNLRHTNLRTQWHYRHADSRNMAAAVAHVSFSEPAPE